jgi:serine/threonine protein kinase
MTCGPGTRLGPYEVLALLGTGGMGEVHRARDTRLNRDVAVKVLRLGIADNPIRRMRFEREAQAISHLSHPNICAVYDVGEQDGIAYLVMEYIEGESLEQRLRRGALSATTAVRLAIQIADALDAAHRRGIVHRDLKPANVMLSGQHVKLLDFGLAKLRDIDVAEAATARDATKSLTAEQTLLGTLHYMAPEQLEGREVDARTDLFAFGALLHEMLTARKAFDGASVASVMAAILTTEPPSVSSAATGESVLPHALDRIVRRALAKSPDERWQTARDLRNELEWILEDRSRGVAAAQPSMGRRTRWVRLVIAASGMLLAGFATYWSLTRTTSPPVTPTRLSFSASPGTSLTSTGRQVLTISPDGKRIVFAANQQLYIRRLDAAEPIPIPGTQNTYAYTPFFSPDGRWVAFFARPNPGDTPTPEARGELKRIPVEGGAAVTISPLLGATFGASWTGNDQILFAVPDGVFRVAATGGTPQKLVDLKEGEAAYGPQLLPDGDHLLLTVTTAKGAGRWDQAHIIAQSLSSGARTELINPGADGRYLDTGHIVYAVGTTLFAVPADVHALRILGPPVIMVRGVARSPDNMGKNTAAAFAAVSKSGDLAYIPPLQDREVHDGRVVSRALVGLGGDVTPLPDNVFWEARFSPDGSQALGLILEPRAWWIYSLNRAAPRKLAAEGITTSGLWTPDGTRITFRSQRESGTGIYWQRADGGGSVELLLAVDGRPVGWSRDGHTLFYIAAQELWSWTRGEQPRSLHVSINSNYASLSPDRQWVAFHTYDSGRTIPYVQSLSNAAKRFRISPEDGHSPLWSPDGRTLFYVSADSSSLMAVDVQTTPTVAFEKRVVRVPEIVQGLNVATRNYDVTPDGKRLLVVLPTNRLSVEVVLGWTEELKRRVPTQ